ncbi:glucokinase [Hydrogenovibrio halophilus]|uniref:glucokinase n=1 Tax=Hydrogenovibrio halophilus TaxID=373391 RepID=UPI0003635F97|nr:glucokinase [Hydrogenovibrio halophilus]
MSVVLAADAGATKVLLQARDTASKEVLAEARYLSKGFPSLVALVKQFQNDYPLPVMDAAVFGVPGPVNGRLVDLTNLPWRVEADELENACGFSRVKLVNDFYAAARGVDELHEDDWITLQEGQIDPQGNRLVIGAGSGLGVAPVKNCDGRFIPQSSEGGHIDFAPVNDAQMRILTWLRQKWSHVSYERLLSGEGLETLYHFYSQQSHGHGRKRIRAAEMLDSAQAGDAIAQSTLETFVEVYGAYVGNAALIWEARAGVFLAGGIAPKIQDWMRSKRFMEGMLSKGRMRSLVAQFPVKLVVNESVGLLGALAEAEQLAKE